MYGVLAGGVLWVGLLVCGVVSAVSMGRIKYKQLDHWQYLDTVLELLAGTKKNCKN